MRKGVVGCSSQGIARRMQRKGQQMRSHAAGGRGWRAAQPPAPAGRSSRSKRPPRQSARWACCVCATSGATQAWPPQGRVGTAAAQQGHSDTRHNKQRGSMAAAQDTRGELVEPTARLQQALLLGQASCGGRMPPASLLRSNGLLPPGCQLAAAATQSGRCAQTPRGRQ